MSDNESEVTWYIAREGQQHGPLSDAEMRLFVAGGHLRQNDLVWKPGFTDWRPAAEVFPPQAAPVPPPPAAPPAAPQAPATTRPDQNASPQSQGANPAAAKPGGHSASQSPGQSPAPSGDRTGGSNNDKQSPERARPQGYRTGDEAGGTPGNTPGTGAGFSSGHSPEFRPSHDQPRRGEPQLTGDRRPEAARGQHQSGAPRSRVDPSLFAPASSAGSRGEPQFEPRSQSTGKPAADDGRAAPDFGGSTDRDHDSPTPRKDAISLDHGFDDRDQYDDRNYAGAYDSSDADRPASGRIKRLATAAVILVILGGGGYAAYENRETVSGWLEAATQATTGDATSASDTPVVLAPPTPQEASRDEPSQAPSQTARLETPSQPSPAFQVPSGPRMEGVVVSLPPPQPADTGASTNNTTVANAADPARVTPDVIDANFQKSELWSLMKREFPDWYGQRVQEVAAKSAGNEATDVSGYLINELVALRRKHANEALSASNDKLREVAEAFLVNLKNLSTHSTDTCFEFISKGEASKTVIELFPREAYGNTIEAQIAAVFEAVAEGRKTPISRQAAQKPDYDLLAMELGKIGWTQDDLKLFANPKALSEAPRERVCKMVQDWFQAHIDIQDRNVQDRLLFVTLRPVIAG